MTPPSRRSARIAALAQHKKENSNEANTPTPPKKTPPRKKTKKQGPTSRKKGTAPRLEKTPPSEKGAGQLLDDAVEDLLENLHYFSINQKGMKNIKKITQNMKGVAQDLKAK
eukprot:CAMPEP_0201606568 /NCGR_PEP_ID=MMETSP0492-20130828/5976_1 /ASSEMBLY_ACC=CAM_ASM_000837 /TAXON_ID=420259 /ORGANISM="Thalassiosira gravida, Strain GMp14c1" /LENGTH=111 /DNA_ID=CAMNT_0048070997 /DNA_START=240 /DNA_END=572 /DNA_ORIENTATION=+